MRRQGLAVRRSQRTGHLIADEREIDARTIHPSNPSGSVRAARGGPVSARNRLLLAS